MSYTETLWHHVVDTDNLPDKEYSMQHYFQLYDVEFWHHGKKN